MKRKKWVNKLIALLLAAIMVMPSSLGTIAYAQDRDAVSEQVQNVQDTNDSQDTVKAEESQKEETDTKQEEEKKEDKSAESAETHEVKLTKPDNGLLSFPLSEDELVKADPKNAVQSILDAAEDEIDYESKDSYAENSEVKIQASADYGYELDHLEVTDKDDNVLQELSVDEEGTATFTMPEEDVKVEASFKEIPESVIEDAGIDLQSTAANNEIATQAASTKSIYLNVPGSKIWYGRYNTRYYTTNEGQVAYCMNPLLKSPSSGWYTGSLINDGNSRKAFYYVFGGPGYSQFVNRYGWIWDGVRDHEYAYSHIIVAYTYSKYALRNNSLANYAFYGLPNSTKNYLINKANQILYNMGGIPSGYSVYYFTTSYNHQPMAFQVNNVATLSLRKSSSNPDITNGNNCYSLANAKYGVYSNAGCTSQVGTFTTNANGTSNSINLEPGTYYVKEISAPSGFELDTSVKTVSLSSGENKVVSFTDRPTNDPGSIVIQKKDKYTGNTVAGKTTLAGAQFTIRYYDGFYTRNNLPAKAKKTWVIETKERTKSDGSKVYQALFSDTYKVGGDNFYKEGGIPTIPRGTITIQETKAPEGYRNDLEMTDATGNSTVNGLYIAQITKAGDLSRLMGGQTFEGEDSPVRADIKLTKINGTNNNTMANIPFKITNLDTKESHTVYTDIMGNYDSSRIKNTENTNSDKAEAGVWFGDTSFLSDDLGAFEYGNYSIEELKCDDNTGKILYKGTFKIDSNTGKVLDLGKIINNSIEVKTYAVDNTSGNNNTSFIQQGGIYDYTTGKLTYGKAITDEVNIKGLSTGYAVANLVDKDTGEYIKNKDGSLVQAETKIEPYDDGTYTGQAHQNIIYDNPESMFGKNIVVYERIYELNADGTPNYNKLFVEHTDLNDDLQTVKFQKLNTELTVSGTGLHEVNTASKNITLVDKLTYENFSDELVDLGYYVKAVAKLVDEDGNVITDENGKQITSGYDAKKFTSDMLKNGDAITYSLPASVVKKYAGKKMISQVELYFAFDTDTTYGDPWNLWTYENDTSNELQTVTIPAVVETNVSSDLVGHTDTGIKDEVSLTGLTRGNTYTLVGKIKDKETGKVISKSRSCSYGKDAYDIANVVPADEGNYTVKKFDTYNVYYLKKSVSSSGISIKEGYYRLNDDGTQYILCTESGQVLDDTNGIKKDLFENEILYPGEEFKEVTELTAKKTFVASKNDCLQYVDFEFDPDELSGKSYVITEDLYFSKLRDAGTEFDDENDGMVYAILYTDGTLTFQKSKNTYSSKVVKEKYAFYENEDFGAERYNQKSIPWNANRKTIQTVEFKDTIKPVSTAYWFNECSNLTKFYEKNLNTSQINNMERMFYNCNSLNSLNLSDWDTSNVTNMSHLFYNCSQLTNLDCIKDWDTSNVTDMSDMFSSCHELTNLDCIKDWDTSNVTDMSHMFSYSKLTNLDCIKDWDTSKVTNMSYLIDECAELTDIDFIKNWDTSNVTNMSYMFRDCKKLTNIDSIKNLNTAKVTDLSGMFCGDTAINSFDLNAWDTSNVTDMSNMFYCCKIKSIKINAWDTSKVTNMSSMFDNYLIGFGDYSLHGIEGDLYLTNWDTSKVTNMSKMFNCNDHLSKIYVSDKWKVTNVSSSDNMFDGCSKLVGQSGTAYDYKKVDKSMANYESGYLTLSNEKLTSISQEKTAIVDNKKQVVAINSSPKATDGLTLNEILNNPVLYNNMDINMLSDNAQMKNDNGTLLYSHNNLQDEKETFYVPKISTTLTNEVGEHFFKIGTNCVLIDTVTYKGLKPGKTYTLKGELKDNSGWSIYDSKWLPITATQTFTPSETNGTVQIKFTFDSSKLAGETIVAYETLTGINTEYGWSSKEKEVAIHQDLKDENQTVRCVSLSTNAKDGDSNTKQITHSSSASIIDTITYSGFGVGSTYYVEGTVIDKLTGEVAKDGDGKYITASEQLIPDKENGTKDITFSFNANGMAGGQYVVFEKIYQKSLYGFNQLVISHEDINDENQTVTLENISTNIYDAKNNTNYTYAVGPIEAHDVVNFEGLIPGKAYTLTGTLIEKKTGNVFIDATGKKAEITKSFTPTSDSGEVDMVFNIDVSNLKSSALVAYETLSSGNKEIVKEQNINNEQQTLHFPIISTSAIDKKTNTKDISAGNNMTIIDTITYEGVQFGMDQTIKTYLVDKSTGKIVQDDNENDIVKETEWSPEATDGSIDIEIPIANGKKLAGKTLVVFEEIYLGDALIAAHRDINDSAQTLTVSTAESYKDASVIKRIKADDYWKEHGDPTFIFKLTGTDTVGATHTYYQSVTFTESYVKNHTDSDGYVEMKALFEQIPAGEYTCSEESVSRFEFESLTKAVNATISGKTAVYHLTDNDTASVTFTNRKYEEGGFGHSSVVVNHFNHKTTD